MKSFFDQLVIEGKYEAVCKYGKIEVFSEENSGSSLNIHFSDARTFRYFLHSFSNVFDSLSKSKGWLAILKNRGQIFKIYIDQKSILEGGKGALSIDYLSLLWQYFRFKVRL